MGQKVVILTSKKYFLTFTALRFSQSQNLAIDEERSVYDRCLKINNKYK